MVLADSHGISRAPCYLGTPSRVQSDFAYGAVTLCGRNFHCGSAITWICNSLTAPTRSLIGPTTPILQRRRAFHRMGLGSSRFARHYSGSRGCFLFLGVLRCFNSPGSLYRPYVFRPEWLGMTPARFPYSDIPGSKVIWHLTGAYRSLSRPS